jgi:uncharacterized RDD family membrane protein YckC
MTGRYGGFWRRLLAYIVDWIILYFVSLILLVMGIIALGPEGSLFAAIAGTGGLPRGLDLFLAFYAATVLFTGMGYYIWFHGAGGQTPGKMLLRLRVIQVNGEAITFGIAFLRWTGSLVSGLVFGLGYIWIAFDPKKQGWHDKIAATLVTRVGNEPAPENSAAAYPEAPASAQAPAPGAAQAGGSATGPAPAPTPGPAHGSTPASMLGAAPASSGSEPAAYTIPEDTPSPLSVAPERKPAEGAETAKLPE